MPSKRGFGNTRKKGSTYQYGVDSKNPIMMKSPMHDEKPTKEEKKEYKDFLNTVYAGKDTREMKREKRKYFKHYKKTGRKVAPPGVE